MQNCSLFCVVLNRHTRFLLFIVPNLLLFVKAASTLTSCASKVKACVTERERERERERKVRNCNKSFPLKDN